MPSFARISRVGKRRSRAACLHAGQAKPNYDEQRERGMRSIASLRIRAKVERVGKRKDGRRVKKDFMFTNKEHTLRGIMATILGVISLTSLVYIIVESYTKAGEIPLQYGAVAFLTMIFAFVGIVLGVLSKSERDKFYFFSYLGIVLNVLVLAALSVILYAGAYA